MNKRFLQCEQLEDRKLLAGDITLPLGRAAMIGDSGQYQTAYDQMQIQVELASAFAWRDNASIAISDRIVVVDQSSLYVIDPTHDVSDVAATLTFDRPISHVLKVGEDRFMVATTSVPDNLPLRVGTSLFLLSISGDGKIEIIDEMESVASLTSLRTVERGLVLANWSLADQFAGAREEFADADIKLTGSEQLWQKGGLEFLDLSTDRLDTELRIETMGFVSAQYAGNGLVIANSESGLEIFDVARGVREQIHWTEGDRVLSIVSADSLDSDELSAVIKTETRNVLVQISRDGLLLGSEPILDNDSGVPIVAGVPLTHQHRLLKSLYGNGVTSAVTAYPIDNSDDLAIVTEQADGLQIQRMLLPFERTGFRPAFAVDDDSIIVVRADISTLEESSFTAPSDTIKYRAFLLQRQSNGQFAVTDQLTLDAIDFDASAVVSPGVVTFRSMNEGVPGEQALVVRVDGDHLLSNTLMNGDTEITGFSSGVVNASRDSVSYHQWATPQVTDSVLASNDLRFDVSGDGEVSALDALIVLNQLNRSNSDMLLASGEDLSELFDVNGDGHVSALDALVIINRLNQSNGIASQRDHQDEDEAEDKSLMESAPILLF
ncbi:dockerin type I domain-containing protein [Allorhodopirellula heiligendammensis]|nr:dockerin type I domain-containing protein [Allorhodopirellula heiligendammensis]